MEPYSNSASAEPSAVLEAALPDGRRVPIIDIDHPAFAVHLSDTELEAQAETYERESGPLRELPPDIRAALAQSTLGAAVMASSGTYLAGLPLLLVNIAGGAAADSWNTLMCLRRELPGCLEARHVAIAVFDGDAEGPAFGAAAVRHLKGPGAPLEGLDLEFRPRRTTPSSLERSHRTASARGGWRIEEGRRQSPEASRPSRSSRASGAGWWNQ